MALLDPTRWRELAPEFEAAQHITRARETLKESNPRAAMELDTALRYLHPRVLDPAAQAEYAALSGAAKPAPAPDNDNDNGQA